MDQLDLIDIYRAFHPKKEKKEKKKKTEFTIFSSVHGTFSRINHILVHKSSLDKFKTITIISGIFSDHNAVKLDVNKKKGEKKC